MFVLRVSKPSLLAASSLFVAVAAYACSEDDEAKPPAVSLDASLAETGRADTGSPAPDGGADDGAANDGGPTNDTGSSSDGGPITSWSCGSFSENPGWTITAGFRAVVVAKGSPLSQPVALTFAQGAYGGLLYVVNQGDNVLRTVNTNTGAVAPFAAGAQWGARAPVVLTTITWDEENVIDGQLYVGDQGSDGDNDSFIYRVPATGAASTFVGGAGPGLDDVFGLAFAPKDGGYPQGLYVTGDTDSIKADWGVFMSGNVDAGLAFSEVTGTEGISFVRLPAFNGALLASRPNGGGYAGADEVSRILADGGNGTPLATGITGVHAVTYSTGGAFGQNVYVASWQSGRLVRIDAAGTQTELASGLVLTNYDGNILAVSPDGNTMMVADRGANRIVCIEPI